MEFTTTNPCYIYGQPDYPFKHYYHPYIVQFLENEDNLLVHRLRIAVVLVNTDRLSFRQEVPVQMVEEAMQDELDFNGELYLYASLGCFRPSELLAEKWNTIEGIHQMLNSLYKLFRRM